MSTTLESTGSSAYVDFDEYVEFQLEKTRHGIKWTDLFTAASVVAAFVVGYLLIFAVLDHWVVPGGFSRTARFVMAGGLLAVSLGWLSWQVLIPWLRRVSTLYAARTLERSEPGLKSTLLNLVDLRRAGREVPEEIRSALEKRAAQALSKMDVDQAVDRRPLMRAAYVLLALVAALCLYSVFSPKKISFARALVPPANVGPATRTVIVDVRTDPPLTRTAEREIDVVARTQLEVIAEISGEDPDTIDLLYTTADRKFVDEPVTMRRVEEGLKQYRGVLNGENGRGILQSTTFRIVAGDDVSPDYKVLVNQPPAASIQRVRFDYPEYMELESKTQPGGNIDEWEGTKVTLTAAVNRPVKSAVLQFFDDETARTKAEELRMQVSGGTTLRAEWTLKFRTDGTFARSYRIFCVTEEGQSDPEPALYTLSIRPDRRPVVELLDPRSDLKVPANAVIPLLIDARDPDFKLEQVALHRQKNGELLPISPVIFEGLQQEFRGTWDWHLKPLDLKAGDVITYWVQARDNKTPSGNLSEKRQLLELHIVDRVPQEEADRQLKADRERIERRMDEARENENQEGRPEQPQQNEGERGEEAEQQGEGGKQETKPGEGPPQDDPQQEGGENAGEQGNRPGGEGERPADGAQQPDDEQKPSEAGDEEPGDKESQRPLDNEGRDDAEALRRLLEEHERQQERQKKEDGEQRQSDPKEGDRPDKPEGAKPEKGAGDASPDDEKPAGDNEPGPGDEPKPGDKPQEGDDADKGRRPEGAGNEGGDAEQKQGSDKGDSQGKPTNADDDSKQQNKPGGGGEKRKPGMNDAKPADKPLDGEEKPADDSPDAQKKKATGDEEGPAKGNDDPNADATKAKNELEREQGEKGARRPSQEKPDENTAKEMKDGAGSRNPNQARPSQQTKKGEPGSKEENPDKRPSQPKESDPDSPPARQDNNPDKGNDDLKGKGRPDGQSSEKPQGGEEGSGKPNDQGKPGSNKPGAGDSTGKPGMEEKSDSSRPGEPGGEPGEGSNKGECDSKPGGESSKPGEKGDGGDPGDSSSDSSQGEGKPGESPGGSSKPGAEPKGGGGNARGGANRGPNGDGGSGEGGLSEIEKANMEYNKKAANLVLKRMQDDLEQGKTDQELLDKLGWTEDDLKRYLERMQKKLKPSGNGEEPKKAAEKRQIEEFLKAYNLRRGTSDRDRSTGGVAPRPRPVPAEFREAFDAYTRELSRKASRRNRKSDRP